MIVALYIGTLFVVGLFVGSFLNVVAWRAPLGMSILTPPSACPSCRNRIAAADNVPVLGYLLLRGKCRNCGTRIPVRYLLAELATGVLWGAVGYKAALLDQGAVANTAIALVWLAFVSTALVTFITDCDHLIILDEISLGGLALALPVSLLLPYLHHAHSPEEFARVHMLLNHLLPNAAPWLHSLAASFAGALTGLAFSLFLYFFGNAAFKKQIAAAREDDPEIDSALGLGDVKLMAFYGALLGWFAVLFIYIVASALGVGVGVGGKLLRGDPEGQTGWRGLKARWRNSSSVIPFGPFLVLAAILYLFVGDAAHAWFNPGAA